MVFYHDNKKVATTTGDETQGFTCSRHASHHFPSAQHLLVGSRQDTMKTTESLGPGCQASVFLSINWGCYKAPSEGYDLEGKVMSWHGHSDPPFLEHLGYLVDSKHIGNV